LVNKISKKTIAPNNWTESSRKVIKDRIQKFGNGCG